MPVGLGYELLVSLGLAHRFTECPAFSFRGLLVVAMSFHVPDKPFALTKALEALQHLLNRFVPTRPDFYQTTLLYQRTRAEITGTQKRKRTPCTLPALLTNSGILKHQIDSRQRGLSSRNCKTHTTADDPWDVLCRNVL